MLVRYEYDELGRKVKVSYCDQDGDLVENRDGIAWTGCDWQGNDLKLLTGYGADGSLVRENEVDHVEPVYDGFGDLVDVRLLDQDGNSIED